MKTIKDDDILNNISEEQCIKVIEEAFSDYTNGTTTMPHKVYLDLPQFNGDFRAMPAYNQQYNIAGIKWVNAHPENIKKNIPSVMATMLINNPITGELIAIMEATAITALRTGAAGALGVKYCANYSANTIAFIGTGKQAITQFNCINTIHPCDTIYIFDTKSITATKFKSHISQASPAKVIITSSVEEAVCNADIIVTTTPSTSPIIKKKWLKPSAHINAIGADAKGKQECDHEIIKNSQLIVDDMKQAIESGEINTGIQKNIISPKHISASLGELITKKKAN